jgi:hypothetical protein
MYFDTMMPLPAWREHYRTHDQTPHYGYLKSVLKVLQFLRGGDRWVLKSPQHLEQFGPISTVFPDATFVVTHRDPVNVLTSMITMLAYTARMTHDPVDVDLIADYWSRLLEEMLGACVRDRELLPDGQAIDVRFPEFMADDVAMVERVYGLAGVPFTPEVRATLEAFMVDHPRGRHGTVDAQLSDYGLDEDEWRARLAFYADRFAL